MSSSNSSNRREEEEEGGDGLEDEDCDVGLNAKGNT